ncbi:MAG: 16S rRNA (uracil(1498)-N(3))-methyltransferase [Cyanobacteria bacterium P01_D01_bin.156]
MQRITIEPAQRVENVLRLTNEQNHYLQRVLRLKPGDMFIAQDGKGHQWQSQLTETPGKAHILSSLAQSVRPANLELVAALPKTGFDDVVRQATELGVTNIQPLLSTRTLLKPSNQKLLRWQRIIQEASEQCERGYIPKICSPVTFQDWITTVPNSVGNFFCVARVNAPTLLACVQSLLIESPQLSLRVVIGPEGGWTSEEITVALAHGFQETSLGSGILRATTASLAAISIVSAVREQLI